MLSCSKRQMASLLHLGGLVDLFWVPTDSHHNLDN